MKRSFVFAATALLSVAGLLSWAESAAAQIGIGVGVGRGYGGIPSAGYYRGYGYPGIYGLPRGMELYPYRPGYYNPPNYFPTYPQYPQQQQGRSSYYYGPSVVLPAAPVNASVRLQVIVPENAQVWVDNHKTSSTGTNRYFDSPPLDPARVYSYTLKAEWQQDGKPMSAEKTVSVTAGSQPVVDFTKP
ncbi:MAG: TIGR03000 domain-containing protein [Planctomycetia bacterium]|nr:TIGR03000 domain-containing protein [Planctomycetia bacterium]